MKIAVASDHAGFELKKGIMLHLKEKEITFTDFGCFSDESVDYVDFAEKALDKVVSGEFHRALLVCGTGLGMGIVGNKYRGIRATPCIDTYMAKMSRRHNDSNCLTLGGRLLPLDEALEVVDIWLETDFEDGRHEDRLKKIEQIENKNCR